MQVFNYKEGLSRDPFTGVFFLSKYHMLVTTWPQNLVTEIGFFVFLLILIGIPILIGNKYLRRPAFKNK